MALTVFLALQLDAIDGKVYELDRDWDVIARESVLTF